MRLRPAITEEEAFATLLGNDPDAAAEAEEALWALWCRASNPEIEKLFSAGVEAMESHDLEEAETIFSTVIERAPEFAEGWNKRATVRYLAGNYEGSIADCEQTLSRNTEHFGALSGEGLCYMAIDKPQQAAGYFMRALSIHPHLSGARRNLAAAMEEAAGAGEETED